MRHHVQFWVAYWSSTTTSPLASYRSGTPLRAESLEQLIAGMEGFKTREVSNLFDARLVCTTVVLTRMLVQIQQSAVAVQHPRHQPFNLQRSGERMCSFELVYRKICHRVHT